MNVLKLLSSSAVAALLMATSLTVNAEAKPTPAPQALEAAVAKTQAALDALKSGASPEEVIKMLKEASDTTSEIYSNYKSEKTRDTVIIKLKAVRKQLTAGEKPQAEEALQKALEELSGMKNTI